MVMRSRGGGAGAPNRGGARLGGGVVRPVYEDFKPKSEWQQNDELHILDINLPGFTKEQIKVSTEGRNTIRVRGERLVGGNKWSRFLENFQVPQNGEMNSIRAKFQGGTLNITISKSKTDIKPQDQNLRPTTPKTIDDQKQPTTPIKRQESSHDPTTKKEPNHDPTAKNELSQDPTAKNELSHDPTAKNESSHDPMARKEPSHDPTAAKKESSHDPIMAKRESSEHTKQERIETKEKQHVASGKNDNLARKKGEKKRENKEEINNGELKLVNEKYKKGVKGIVHELNEERQLLVNMGVALLVIVALTAHITYKFATPNFK
ncbi:hypothetical protein ABFX02_14G181400 [Erythranthe guttata]